MNAPQLTQAEQLYKATRDLIPAASAPTKQPASANCPATGPRL